MSEWTSLLFDSIALALLCGLALVALWVVVWGGE